MRTRCKKRVRESCSRVVCVRLKYNFVNDDAAAAAAAANDDDDDDDDDDYSSYAVMRGQ